MRGVDPARLFFITTKKLLIFSVIGLLFLFWLLNTPAGLLGKADAIGYAVCHRIETRSFFIGERQLPLCIRCSGMYLGAMLGLVYQWGVSKKRSGMPHWRLWMVFGVMVLAFGIDGFNSYLHLFPNQTGLYEPQNWLRLATGTGMGLTMAALLYPAFNQTVWQEYDNAPAIGGFRSLGGLITLAVLLDITVLTKNPLILYPLALVSALGVLLLLSLVYTMLWLILFKTENCFQTISQLFWPLWGGFGTALLQIVFINLLRYWLTGSWNGFEF